MEPDTNTKNEIDASTQHVVPVDERWGVRAENSEQPSKIFDLKMNAIIYAFDIAEKREGGKVVVHDPEGNFQNVNLTDDTSKLMTILRS